MAYEERRLDTPLPNTGANVTTNDTTPIATRILQATGFDTFGPAFATALCGANGRTEVTSYDQALAMVKSKGTELWRAAVDRVQGRRAQPAGSTYPRSDDRMLYWARVQMTKALRQWKPSFALTDVQKEELQWQLERHSRGQLDINLPEGNAPGGAKYRRMIMSGFDTFTLGVPGTPNTGLRNGNPSGATALEMDGREFTLSDGSILHVESYILPVSYDPFNLGMQEDTIGPYFRPGPKRVDASITISQGSANVFNIEAFNGRFHGPSAGNDGKIYCPAGNERLPSTVLPIGTISGTAGVDPITLPNSGCDVYPPVRWLGYQSANPWMKDFPPQFSNGTLPVPAMVTGSSRSGVIRPPGATSQGTEGFDVTWHTNYTYFPDCTQPATVSVPSNGVMNSMPDLATVAPPPATSCARQGGGGDYLSNESAYRNTVLRDVFALDIPAGHIHVPVMTNFFGGTTATGGGTRNDNAITDARFEAYRTAIVQQTKNLLVIIGNSLTFR
ncbi:hypothetical protein HQN59_02130 [Schlegelella sp. ID0723]|uniref:Uncharacterized protein n=1 Tax=Piscinibacter koreensis TaxID=2742824 RepID=A0A7Y6TV14_9BURK|nr:hypothetical protein [Schlegelella koreensis]